MPNGQTPPGSNPVAASVSSGRVILVLTPSAALSFPEDALRSPGQSSMTNRPSFPRNNNDLAICPTWTPSCCAASSAVAVVPGGNSMACRPWAARRAATCCGIMRVSVKVGVQDGSAWR
jgi:hypothetical protein